MKFFKCYSLGEYVRYLNRIRQFKYHTYEGHNVGQAIACRRVIGTNVVGLRRYDYQRKLNQHYNRQAA